jgi:hypothetical protein
MSTICTNLENYSYGPLFEKILSDFPYDYFFDATEVLRRWPSPICPHCGEPMAKNGFNKYGHEGIGFIKIGRWICKPCHCSLEEDRTLWENMMDEFDRALTYITVVLQKHNVSWKGISDVVSVIYPRSHETTRNMFNKAIDWCEVPVIEDYIIVHYDEQFPKEGRTQKYRLSLMEGTKKQIIAEGLFDDKSPETIKKFFKDNIDTSKPVYIITDFGSSYPGVFDEVFINGYSHQYCLFHLNKLIVKDFPRKCTIKEEHWKYEMLNIFYDRSRELKFLDKLLDQEKQMKKKSTYDEWLKTKIRKFRKFVHQLENERRRKKNNHIMRNSRGAAIMFNKLGDKYDQLPKYCQTRLHMISKHWKNLNMFYLFKDAPATNNRLENYYSTSLKTDKKRKYRTDEGIERKIKLSQLCRADLIGYNGPSLIKIIQRFMPFMGHG